MTLSNQSLVTKSKLRDVSFFMRKGGGGSVDFHFGLQNIF